MSKRKRGDDTQSHNLDDLLPAQKQQRRGGAHLPLAQCSKELVRAFKTAQGFERQKLGRRKRNAAGQDDIKEMMRIDSEIAALKTLDSSSVTEQYLSKCLLKIKSVAGDSALREKLSASAPDYKDTAVLNVFARMCNSNPVKEALPSALGEITRRLGIQADLPTVAKKRRLRAKDYNEETQERAREVEEGNPDRISVKAGPRNGNGTGESLDQGSLESDVESDLDLDKYQDRLASSDDESVEETSDIEKLQLQLQKEGIATSHRPYDHAAEMSLSDSASQSKSTTPEPRKAGTIPVKKSSFLPSLTLGGYISGSDSDPIDDYDNEKKSAPKKNRRGQRARQQIWEQKYGSRAKHLQNPARDRGWDLRRGAVDNPQRWKNGRASFQDVKGSGRTSDRRRESQPTHAEKKTQRDDTGPLHPSWEAAKKAKEKSNAAPVVFQGTKIRFD